MGFYTHISVVFSCNEKEGIITCAKDFLTKNSLDSEDGSREAKWFVEDCATGRGYVCGPKGALYTWGLVGNYTNAEKFVEVLMPFWDQLLGKAKDCGFDFEHINVFYEPEQSEQAQCYEIYREAHDKKGAILIKHHDALPFCWRQF